MASKPSLSSCTVTGRRTDGERGMLTLVSLGGKYQVVKREGKLGKDHKTLWLANPIPIPVTHLGNEVQVVDGKSKTGRQVKVCLSRLIFTCAVSHYSIIYLGINAISELSPHAVTLIIPVYLPDLCGQHLDSCESLLWHPQFVRPRLHQVVPGEVTGNSSTSRLCYRWELSPWKWQVQKRNHLVVLCVAQWFCTVTVALICDCYAYFSFLF